MPVEGPKRAWRMQLQRAPGSGAQRRERRPPQFEGLARALPAPRVEFCRRARWPENRPMCPDDQCNPKTVAGEACTCERGLGMASASWSAMRRLAPWLARAMHDVGSRQFCGVLGGSRRVQLMRGCRASQSRLKCDAMSRGGAVQGPGRIHRSARTHGSGQFLCNACSARRGQRGCPARRHGYPRPRVSTQGKVSPEPSGSSQGQRPGNGLRAVEPHRKRAAHASHGADGARTWRAACILGVAPGACERGRRAEARRALRVHGQCMELGPETRADLRTPRVPTTRAPRAAQTRTPRPSRERGEPEPRPLRRDDWANSRIPIGEISFKSA